MKQTYALSTKQMGIVLIIVSVVLGLIFLSSTYSMINTANADCGCSSEGNLSCPHSGSIPLQSYFGFTATFVLAGFGVFVIRSGKKLQEEITEKQKELDKKLATLDEDEKNICEAIKGADGAMFQSELIEKIGFTKVKVSRILDKLEGRGIIERRRRGMTNLVILKRN